MDTRLPPRFWSKVVPEPNSGCWLWVGALDSSGYGCFGSGQTRGAHRIAYAALVADPGAAHLDHRCRTRCCVNPDHLEAVTNRANVLRGVGTPALNARKTECRHGHPLTGDNLGVSSSGGRRCKTCHRRERQEQLGRMGSNGRASRSVSR